MKTNRFSPASTRAAAFLLAGLFLAAGLSAAGKTIRLGRLKISLAPPSKKLAQALAPQVEEVQKRFDENRRALHTVQGPRGEQAYLPQDVASLVATTKKDLDQAIERIGEPGLEGLRAWSAEKLRPIQEELAAPASRTAALPPGLFTPRAVAVVASLGRLPLPELASVKAAAPKRATPKKAVPKQVAPKEAAPKPVAPKPETITAEKTNSLLDQVGEVVGRIFFLAAHDDLEVELWVGSTPAPRVTFTFSPQGRLKGSAPAPMIIRTDGKRDHVLRGLYSYKAAWSKGAVTQLVEYPNPAGASAARLESERLDLVNGSSFFCCRFNEQYCHHVANEKDCRP